METNNKLREAMIEILEYIETFHKYITPGNGKKLTVLFAVADTIRNKARAALAEPPRQCDVGTPEEQAKRMDEFCDSHGHRFDGHGSYACENCEFISVDRCELAWAQMPYAAEEGGAK